jgi:pectate lyase
MRVFSLATFALSAGSFAIAVPLTARAATVDQLVGYGAGTTGGGSGAGTTVTSCAALTTALKAGGIIRISGTLAGCGVLKVPSNTSVLGVGKNSGLTEGGFQVRKVSNVIIRNLQISPPKKGDAIDIDASTKIWIDHCDLHSLGLIGGKDDYDGLLDAKHGSDFITVSWTKFHDHVRSIVITHSYTQLVTNHSRAVERFTYRSFRQCRQRRHGQTPHNISPQLLHKR